MKQKASKKSSPKGEAYKPRTEEELKQIAKDLWAGQIFCDRQISDKQLLTSVFMPLVFLSVKDVKELKRRNIDFIFEYLSSAGPRSINGMPVFMSCQLLSKSDTERMLVFYSKFVELAKNL
jgi:hypothetical protein